MSALSAATALRRGRVVVASLAALTAACWCYLFAVDVAMGTMGSPLAMPMTSVWSLPDLILMLTMWVVMMAAMMIPSAAPMIAAYAATVHSPRATVEGSTPLFVIGYVAVWGGFALVATGAQWALHDAALVNAMGASTSRWLAGPVLVAAGAYQFTGLKRAMLGRCRTPLGFLLTEWRSGARGAFLMGAHHGVLCVGCCWALMGLLFVFGVMNLWWIAALTTVVLVEKVTTTDLAPRVLGTGLAMWGGLTMLGAWP